MRNGHVQNEVLSSTAVDALLGPQSFVSFSTMREYKDPTVPWLCWWAGAMLM